MGRGDPLKADNMRYRPRAIALHWLLAVVIIGMLILGFLMVDIPRNTPARGFYFNLHKSIGVLAGLVILLRLFWRLREGAPPFPSGMPRWEAVVARWSHRALYVLMVAMPATGYISSSFNKYGVKVFGVPLPSWGWEDKELRELFADIHGTLAIVLAVLVALHVLGAIKHLAIDRDGVFQRMLPRR